jgi:hypothetical protein
MYTTLLREVDEEANLIQKQAAATSAGPTSIMVKDMKSREVWSFDDQADISMDYDIAVSNPTDVTSTSMIKGMEVNPGIRSMPRAYTIPLVKIRRPTSVCPPTKRYHPAISNIRNTASLTRKHRR